MGLDENGRVGMEQDGTGWMRIEMGGDGPGWDRVGEDGPGWDRVRERMDPHGIGWASGTGWVWMG